MNSKQRKIAVLAAVIVLLVSIFSALFTVFWDGFTASKNSSFTPQYLTIQGSTSKIFVVSASSSFSFANQTYTSADGQKIAQGSRLYTINLILRNDYSSENPPPSTGTPTAPIDGTAYISLKVNLIHNGEDVPAINLSQSDFSTPSDQTGFVLASGQTLAVQLISVTNQTEINDFSVTLSFVSDSISI